uniref:Rho-GAP domain-containing protein n=1 Tax=Knipowitschia caucasica TaxID=637954 RepID=A0AAV2K7A7_KNICA
MMRRGSYDDAAVSLRPNFRNLAQRRRSAPSLVFGKTLGMPWSPIREESCWVSPEQSPFVLGLTAENGPLLLEQSLQVTEGSKTRERHLFLFRDVLVIAKLRSSTCYRLKHRLDLHETWVLAFDPELEEQVPDSDLDLGLSLLLDPQLCLLTFSSPEPKERWLELLQRNICEARARSGAEWAPSERLMKVLTGNASVKSLSGGGMDHLIELPINATDVKPALTAEEKLSETRWKGVVRRLRSGSSFIHRKKQLFGKSLSKVCPEGALPKAIQEILLLLRHRGPSTEGVFRKSCNSKKMQEVRDQLETGADVVLEELPVVLLVGLLKSFLKELPDSLLDSQLYPRWMSAFNEEDPQQRAEHLQRVVSELPGPNLLLLQHLLCILHHIHQNSETTRMPSDNLAVCIGPTLLWSNSTALDQQAERMKEVSDLTQFLIEHWEIIGDNIPNLLDTDKDSVSSQQLDSAYDSTDPDGDQEPSPSCPGAAASVLHSPFRASPSLLRRCSEPSLSPSTELPSPRHARSRDDCSSSGVVPSRRSEPRSCSCSSLDSTASNQSDGSVFGSSPAGSPTWERGAPCAPPSYQQAVQKMGRPPSYASMTVQDAIRLERQARPQSGHWPLPAAVNMRPRAMSESVCVRRADMAPHRADMAPHRADMAPHRADMAPHRADMAPHRADMAPHRADMAPHRADMAPHRADMAPHRADMAPHRADMAPHRCSPPLFEEFSYAQESYV